KNKFLDNKPLRFHIKVTYITSFLFSILCLLVFQKFPFEVLERKMHLGLTY
ncbi:hypothetical protein S245_066381, partial [Arachis hypogaea]